MMHMEPEDAKFKYADLKRVKLLELPYKGNASMLIILLKNSTAGVASSLTMDRLGSYEKKMRKTGLDGISIPRFEFKTKYMMKDTLREMGMPTAFGCRKANCSAMTREGRLCIDNVYHTAWVKVNEEGTEAAAATTVGLKQISAELNQNVFRADQPFIFLIQDEKTDTILFMGRVTNPNK